MMAGASVANKGLDIAQNMATQRVIGFKRSVTYRKGKKNPKVVQEEVNIGIQVWELGIILAGVALYEYVNGSGSVMNNFTQSLGGFTSPNGSPIITLPGGGM